MHNLLLGVVNVVSMQELCPVISDLFVCETISDFNVAFGLLVSDVKVSDVQVMQVLTSILVSIGLEQHGAFVVLIEDILLDGISLHFRK